MSDLTSIEPLFPIDSIQKVYTLFSNQLASDTEPDLALFSIIVGAVENRLTCVKNSDKDANLSSNKFVKMKFPTVEYEEVKALYERFAALMRGGVEGRLLVGEHASRELVRRAADAVWNALTRSYYKDRAHLQSIYSLLTGHKLDCFGVAFAVTAGCQLLGKRDVHLALSEDHAWVIFGKDGAESAEVTWHGKGAADKRGRAVCPVTSKHSWLYAGGRPIRCSRLTELAALVSAINPALTTATDCHEVATMQHQLLWLLYDKGHLDTYPMALGNLSELEECLGATHTDIHTQRPDARALLALGVRVARAEYDDRHVYPYTLQGGYFYRHKMYKEAFQAWAQAGDVIRHYNYSRDDEEIYKELSEIANELIPQLMKAESSGHSARSILKDPECFASLLRFYDGICKWEEGSVTPILHIGWARPLVSTIARFDSTVRAHVHIDCCLTGDDTPCADSGGDAPSEPAAPEVSVREAVAAAEASRPRVPLRSHKMAALRWLLRAPRLNQGALQLQLTAQTRHHNQVDTGEGDDPGPRAKRQRRDK